MFTLKFKTDNAAFTDYPLDEVARILKEVTAQLEGGERMGNLRDLNGNTVGHYELKGH